MDPSLVSLVIQIAAIGLLVAVLQTVLEQAGKGEWAMAVTVAGLIVVMYSLVELISGLFEAVRTMVQF
ncbi:MAG: stage III sporulation protein AC [Bacillota bacterium]